MAAHTTAKKLLLIGWDAADWKVITPLLDAGLMPSLARLIEGGVMGNLATLRPCLSPILWTSIATGKLADKHGILGFIEPSPDGGGVRLSTSTSRKTKALWNILSQQKLKTHAVAWFASHPAEPINGVCVSDQFMGEVRASNANNWPMPPGAVHPPERANDIAKLRVHPSELRDTDLLPFIPKLAEIDPADERPQKLVAALVKNASVHAAATAILDAEPWDVLAVFYDAIDVVGHEFMLYHPPRLPETSERDFDLYHRVMNTLYQFHDAMLGRLMQLAGDETAIVLVSDHGFHSDHLRPRATGRAVTEEESASLWHRHYGVVAMRGPGIKRDERVYGATLLDITPTILTMLGLPIGSDMDGRVLLECFERPPAIQRVANWDQENGPADPGLHPADLRQDPYLSAEAIEQLIALGYLPEPARDQRLAADIARAEASFNLAATHLYVGGAGLARPILEELHRTHPDEPRYAQWLARAYAKLNLHSECRATMEAARAKFGRSVDADLLLAAAMYNSGDSAAAHALLGEIENRYAPNPTLHCVLGGMHLADRRWTDAQRAYETACAMDDDNEQAHFGLSRALGEQGQFEESADHALRAVGLVHFFPAAHYQLGVALEGMKDEDRAIRAMEVAAAHAPQFVEAHRHLARLYHAKHDVANALKHERAAEGYARHPRGAESP